MDCDWLFLLALEWLILSVLDRLFQAGSNIGMVNEIFIENQNDDVVDKSYHRVAGDAEFKLKKKTIYSIDKILDIAL